MAVMGRLDIFARNRGKSGGGSLYSERKLSHRHTDTQTHRHTDTDTDTDTHTHTHTHTQTDRLVANEVNQTGIIANYQKLLFSKMPHQYQIYYLNSRLYPSH